MLCAHDSAILYSCYFVIINKLKYYYAVLLNDIVMHVYKKITNKPGHNEIDHRSVQLKLSIQSGVFKKA